MMPSCAGVGFAPALLVAESLLAMFFGYTGREQRGTLNRRCNDGSCPKKCSSQLEQQRKIVSCHGAQHLLLPSCKHAHFQHPQWGPYQSARAGRVHPRYSSQKQG